MNKLCLIILSIQISSCLQGMNGMIFKWNLNESSSKKRSSISRGSIQKRSKTATGQPLPLVVSESQISSNDLPVSHQDSTKSECTHFTDSYDPAAEIDQIIKKELVRRSNNETYDPVSLVEIASFAVFKNIINSRLSKEDFKQKTPLDIHPTVERFFETNYLKTLLIKCITGRDSEKVSGHYISRLLDVGANPNILCLEKNTEEYKQKGYRVNLNSLLSAAITAGNMEHIKALVSHPKTDRENNCFINQNQSWFAQERPLITAIVHAKEFPIIKTLVEHGADVNAISKYYYTHRPRNVLQLFCENTQRYAEEKHFEIMEFLLQNGANPFVRINVSRKNYRAKTDQILEKYRK